MELKAQLILYTGSIAVRLTFEIEQPLGKSIYSVALMMKTHVGLALAKRPVQPGAYDGTRDFLAVNTWLYATTEYFELLQESSSTDITELHRVRYASRLLTSTAAAWW